MVNLINAIDFAVKAHGRQKRKCLIGAIPFYFGQDKVLAAVGLQKPHFKGILLLNNESLKKEA